MACGSVQRRDEVASITKPQITAVLGQAVEWSRAADGLQAAPIKGQVAAWERNAPDPDQQRPARRRLGG
ncbi:hypothetical protein BM1_07719 [Bipolaris maydis]|nr:hypothetical protein BM1_07719 [Bipolaris maydis]